MQKSSKIYIAGHTGLVGSAILRFLLSQGYTNFLLRTHKELDLEIQKDVNEFFEKESLDSQYRMAENSFHFVSGR